VTVELPQLVRCGECGGQYTMSARNARAHRAHGTAFVCARCRHPAQPPDPAAVERMKRWWLARYSLDELLELGELLDWR
jgi:hypothetical protein